MYVLLGLIDFYHLNIHVQKKVSLIKVCLFFVCSFFNQISIFTKKVKKREWGMVEYICLTGLC